MAKKGKRATANKRAAHHAKKKRTGRHGAARSHAPLALAATAATTSVLFGIQTVETSLDANPPGWAEAFPFSSTTSGTASSISVYVDSRSHASSLIAGLYSDKNGHPGSLLTTGSLSRPTAGAWNKVVVSSASVQSGQTYWVALLGRGGQLYFRDLSNGACSSENSSQTNLTSLAASWTSGPSYWTCSVSAYVSGTPTGTPAGLPALLPPTNALPPTVSGTAVDGQTLTASQGTWLNIPTSYAYQWQDCDSAGSNCSNIAGATNSSYTLADGDIGHTVRAVVTASNTAGSGSATSSPTGQVMPPPAPANMAAPAVSGSAAQGQTLSTNNGSWTNNPESYRYAWQDCDSSGNNCATISGASSSSYVVGAGDVGHALRSMVTAANAGGSASAPSAMTTMVASTPPTAAFTYSPGSPVTGQAVSFNAGGSTCPTGPCSYSWADDPPSGGSFALGTGQTLSFTFSNTGTKYVTLTVTDAQSRIATVEHDVTVGTAATPPPANSALPTTSGAAQQGSTLTTTNGTWSNSPTSYSYGWEDCNSSGASCSLISGAGASTYTLGAADVGHTIRSVVTAANSGGQASAQSNATSVVTATAPSAPSNSSPPTISGTAQQGQMLTANPGTWTNSPTSYGYAWQDCDSAGNACTAISGATSGTYTAATSDVGHTLRVAVTATNAAGSGSATSAPTAIVAAPSSGSCDSNATTSNFSSQFSALQAGKTLCLASGNYGTFNGGTKSGMVTIKPASGASVTMALNWSGVSNITVTGMTISSALIQGASHDLAITYSTVSPGYIHLMTDQFKNSNILIDHDSFPNTIATSGQGRVWTDFNSVNTTNIIGVTVSNSVFTGGDMIDILIEGGAGLQVLNNEFTGMNNTINEAIHSDTIFNYGDNGHNVMTGNWFHDQVDVPTCGWAQWDGGHDNVFEDNVISHSGGTSGKDGCYQSIAVLDDRNSIIAHNVIEPGTGESGPIGQVDLGGKSSEGAGSGTIIRDNTMGFVSNGDGGLNSTFTQDHNLCVQSCTTTGGSGGTGDITGSPTWVGGSSPTTFDGFPLAPGSKGIGAASDGTNMGMQAPTGG